MIRSAFVALLVCAAVASTASADPPSSPEAERGEAIFSLRAGIGKLWIGGHSEQGIHPVGGEGASVRLGLASGFRFTPHLAAIGSLDAEWGALHVNTGFCAASFGVGAGMRYIYADRVWLEGLARYSHVEDTHQPPDYSGGSCHRGEGHGEVGTVGRVGWFLSPSTGWGMSLDFGTAVAPGGDETLVSVGLNLEWTAAGR